jgi:RNA-binding protein 39
MPGQPALAAHDVMDQRLYVGSVNYSLTEHDLRQVFEPYGPIDFVDLHKGKKKTGDLVEQPNNTSIIDQVTGLSKGYAFIQ